MLTADCLNLAFARQVNNQGVEKEKIAQVVSSCVGWAKTKDLQLL
jgi:hypothetical protein